ncbi:hypothetical protein D9613_000055 [Agrocybe pediades]|uniref:Uncharacterized protein n=1 Tax=Agrocybe pediades TaxID=84607 RepID=A0A8H4VUX6_9AGAR|nr:hypothetical protein D9613_000055 [Agrocybe pediades]
MHFKIPSFTSSVVGIVVVVAATVQVASSAPLGTRQTIDDATVLNYALTLEHIENAFYSGALAKFDAQAFLQAGLPSDARGRFEQIAAHEKAHVDFLTSALGNKATKACVYDLNLNIYAVIPWHETNIISAPLLPGYFAARDPYTDVNSFVALSKLFEGVGVSAYTGAAQLITNKAYLTAAASVLSTEARHASWVASAIGKVNPWSGPLDVPLSLNEVFSLVAPSIVSCPSTNPALPVKAFPALTLNKVAPGKKMSVHHDHHHGHATQKDASGSTFIAFLSGLDTTFVPIEDGHIVVPEWLRGQVYAVATSSATEASDATILAGPAVLQFDFGADGELIE